MLSHLSQTSFQTNLHFFDSWDFTGTVGHLGNTFFLLARTQAHTHTHNTNQLSTQEQTIKKCFALEINRTRN